MSDKINSSQNPEIFNYDDFKRRMLNEEEIIKKIISGLLDRMPGMINELQNHMDNKNLDEIGRQAHKIKGAAANLGCNLFREAALKIEQAAKSGTIETTIRLMPDFESEWKRLKPLLAEACK